LQPFKPFFNVTASQRNTYQRSRAVVAVEIIKGLLTIKLNPSLEFSLAHVGLQFANRLTKGKGKDVPKPILALTL